MATEFQNWLKAYRRKKPNAAINKSTRDAYLRWKRSKSGGSSSGAGTDATKPPALPDGWGMTRTPDILGSWADKPNLDPNQYEIDTNADGRYFARPRTELTGLSPWMVQSIKKYDQDAANRQTLISGAQTQALNANTAIGDAGAGRMKDLATLIQTRSNQGEAGAGAVAGMAAAQSAATEAAANAQNAATNSNTLLANSMATLANKERSDSAAKRTKIMDAYRATLAAAENAKTEAIAQTYTDQARILAAAISSGAKITEQQISDYNANLRNTQDNETAIATTALNSATGASNSAAKAADKERNARVKKRDDYLAKIPGMLQGDISVTTGADGKSSSTVRRAPMAWPAIINDAAAKGIPLGSVVGIIASDSRIGPALKRNRRFQLQLANLLRSKGVPKKTVREVIRKHLGVDLGSNPGVYGPPSP